MTDPQDRMVEGADEARDEAEQLPAVTNEVDAQQVRHFVSEIKSAEQQVGEHIIAALQDPETVAVLTTVVIGQDAKQRIVSAGLDPQMMAQIQHILAQAEREREEEVPCVGFHCYLKKRTKAKPADAAQESPEEAPPETE